MSEVPTRDQIQAAYTKLAAETGDLYFALDNAKVNLAALEARMASLKEQRAALQRSYEAAASAPQEAPETLQEATPEVV